MRIILVRHPACDIEPGRCYGRLDVDLSPVGRAALPALAGTLRETGVARVLTSPALRCRRLAAAIGPAPTVDARLREIDFGAWEGQRWDDVPREQLDAWAADPTGFAPPGGESGAALLARVRAAAAALLRAGEDCIVVTHGGPLRLLPALLRGETPDLLAPAPPLGTWSELHVHTMAVSAAHSATTTHPPSTSPVKPPI